MIKALIFDWAGTTVDHGSLAPVLTLEQVFADSGIRVPHTVIRRDMGMAKRDHITRLLLEPEVMDAWSVAHGEAPPADEVDRLYAAFLPLQMECLLHYSHVLAGVPEAIAVFRGMGMQIGSTTGYTRAMLDALVAAAEEEGYVPDAALTPEDAGAGRPSPAMCMAICRQFAIEPHECIKIGDTPSDIAEGRNAGMWTIGITRTGNMVGLSKADWDATQADEQHMLLEKANAELLQHGANAVAESVAESLPQVEAIISRSTHDERP